MEYDHRVAIIFFLSMLGCFASLTEAYTFYVGGRDGWVRNPKEEYNQWASRMRFLINDTLIFKYKKGNDSVLEVDKDDYFNCNKQKPLQDLEDGDSVFKINRPGPYFFISGHADNCAKGQRIIVAVLHPRNPPAALVPVPVPVPAPALANPVSPPPVPVPVLIPAPTSPVVANSPPPAPTVPAISPARSQDDFTPAPAPADSSRAAILGGSALEFSIFFMGMVTFAISIS